MYLKKRYPVFEIKIVKHNEDEKTYRTTKKNSFHYKLDGLQNLQNIKSATFTIRYGDKAKNESVEYFYDEFKKCLR